jgi:hypothetical protein
MKYDEVVKGPVVTPEFRRISMQQVDLAGDLAIVARYAESIDPDEWAGMWFDNDRDPAVIMVAVTRRIELHRARLRTLMARPKQLDVVKHERSDPRFVNSTTKSLPCVRNIRSRRLAPTSSRTWFRSG